TNAPPLAVVKQIFVSDGTNAKYTKPTGLDTFSFEQKKVPEHLLRSFHVTMLQLPLLDSFHMTTGPHDGLTDLRKVVKLREFKFGEGGKNGSLLIYAGSVDFTARENFEKKSTSFEVKLWYDAKTWTPRKREVTLNLGGVIGTTTETYEQFLLNDD